MKCARCKKEIYKTGGYYFHKHNFMAYCHANDPDKATSYEKLVVSSIKKYRKML